MSFSKLFNFASAFTRSPELRQEVEKTYEHVVDVAFTLRRAGVEDAYLADVCTWGEANFESREKSPVSDEELKQMMDYARTLFQKLHRVTLEQLGLRRVSFKAVTWAIDCHFGKADGLPFESWPDPKTQRAGHEDGFLGKQFVHAVALLVLNVEHNCTAVRMAKKEFNKSRSLWERGEISEEPTKCDPVREHLDKDLVLWAGGIPGFIE